MAMRSPWTKPKPVKDNARVSTLSATSAYESLWLDGWCTDVAKGESAKALVVCEKASPRVDVSKGISHAP